MLSMEQMSTLFICTGIEATDKDEIRPPFPPCPLLLPPSSLIPSPSILPLSFAVHPPSFLHAPPFFHLRLFLAASSNSHLPRQHHSKVPIYRVSGMQREPTLIRALSSLAKMSLHNAALVSERRVRCLHPGSSRSTRRFQSTRSSLVAMI